MTPDLPDEWMGYGPCSAEELQGDASASAPARAATPSGLSRFQRLRASMASLSRWLP